MWQHSSTALALCFPDSHWLTSVGHAQLLAVIHELSMQRDQAGTYFGGYYN